MRFVSRDADVFVPDGRSLDEALARTTHLAVGAHQDDIEFMAVHGVLECYDRADRWFTGITVTDGSGSPRSGRFAGHSDEQMRQVRVAEQRQAAVIGRYSCQIQLMYPSAVVKDPAQDGPACDLEAILAAAAPEVVYLHNPADKHDTHVACCLRSVAALRSVPPGIRPRQAYGCEVWRDLDWLLDDDKQVLPAGGAPELTEALSAVFESQILGGKRYDLAVHGRRLAHATFLESHAVDAGDMVSLAMDLTPLLLDQSLDVTELVLRLLRRTEEDIRQRIARLSRWDPRAGPTPTSRRP